MVAAVVIYAFTCGISTVSVLSFKRFEPHYAHQGKTSTEVNRIPIKIREKSTYFQLQSFLYNSGINRRY